ncbi:MAG: pyrimidine-nucleoside phosphorylase [Syntrophomonadaceae bacterium]|nr:pyrimidine-nucleoside phosphorylase [Syntrophomonadaceae bacterium]
MNTQDIIQKKRDGKAMSAEEIGFLVRGISDGRIPDYQIAAWAMAVYFRGMTEQETSDLTLAMAYSGEVMDLSAIAGKKVDKHSTGGVGDKTTLVVIPLAAAMGVPVAKMSGRGLGHTGGTIDKLESIPGFQAERSHAQFVAQVNSIKAAVVSQTGNLVPADKRLYAIRDVTATVDSIPLIASSIMSKKIAAGAEGIVLDVKVGSGAFMKHIDEARQLAREMVQIGKGVGREVVAVISDMSQPLGYAVGNALEVDEALRLLHSGHGPADLEELSVELTARLVMLAGRYSNVETARQQTRKCLAGGAGYDKLTEMVAAQGGRLDEKDPHYGLPQAAFQVPVRADRDGYVGVVDAFQVGRTAMLLGAGRERIGDTIDPAVGVMVHKKKGDWVQEGDVMAVIYANRQQLLPTALKCLADSYRLVNMPPAAQSLIIDTVL